MDEIIFNSIYYNERRFRDSYNQIVNLYTARMVYIMSHAFPEKLVRDKDGHYDFVYPKIVTDTIKEIEKDRDDAMRDLAKRYGIIPDNVEEVVGP